jgi:hypothetical protein
MGILFSDAASLFGRSLAAFFWVFLEEFAELHSQMSGHFYLLMKAFSLAVFLSPRPGSMQVPIRF